MKTAVAGIDAGGGIGAEEHEQRPELDGELAQQAPARLAGALSLARIGGLRSGCCGILAVQAGDGAGKVLRIEWLADRRSLRRRRWH